MGAVYYVGDAISVMGKLPEKSVDLVLTSPPFLALRSYLPADHPDKALEGGSQPTPGAYIDWLVDVVEACARILVPHGSLCFELGDTYAGSGNGPDALKPSDNGAHDLWLDDSVPKRKGEGWPLAKSLSLIPELFRYTLVYGTNPLTGRTTERWRLRNVIRWVRPNPPVGALGDKFRPATSELMVFCKSAKRFFDLDAVREPHTWANAGPLRSRADGTKGALHGGTDTGKEWDSGERLTLNPAGAPPLDWWNIPPGGYQGAHYAVWPPELCVKPIKAMSPEKVCRVCGEPSRRIVSEPRFIDRRGVDMTGQVGPRRGYEGNQPVPKQPGASWGPVRTVETLGFSDCGHGDVCRTCYGTGEPTQIVDFDGIVHQACSTCHGDGNNYRPGLVLDPFVGSGTTLAVATGHGRDAIGIDLDERNYQLALERVGPFLLELAEM